MRQTQEHLGGANILQLHLVAQETKEGHLEEQGKDAKILILNTIAHNRIQPSKNYQIYFAVEVVEKLPTTAFVGILKDKKDYQKVGPCR